MSDIEKRVKVIAEEAIASVVSTESENALEEIRIATLGKKGSISLLMKELSNINKEDRAKVGSILNKAKGKVVFLCGSKVLAA